jgi:pyruvate dehydrogenase E2 component (dihydrolipoamide acetyltransferase)
VETSVEVRYAGVVVGRGAVLRDLDAEGTFVCIAEPMPVGTLVTLKIGDSVREARVDEVVESAEPSTVGMRVRFDGVARTAAPVTRPEPAEAAAPVTRPEPAEAAAPVPQPEPATPVVEMSPPPLATPVPAPTAAVAPAVAPVAAAPQDASGPLPAPLSLAGPAADASHPGGGGKRRRKRR